MKAIIIAAGRGIRMGALTDEKPKCLLELNGITLLQNLINRFNSFGINDIAIVTGYCGNKINFPGLTVFNNKKYEDNNILHSLMHAREFIDGDTIISYSDIWLEDEPLCHLINNPSDLVLSVDKDWMGYYQGRTEHTIEQAENVFFDDNFVTKKIGKHLNPDLCSENESCGEFIGLFKIRANFVDKFKSIFNELEQRLDTNDPFQQSKSWQKAYLTDFFSEVIENGFEINCSTHEQGWAEIDTAQDFEYQVAKFKEQEYIYKKKVGALILSEANDLKRTVSALANDLNMNVKELQDILDAKRSVSTLQEVITLMSEIYPIDSSTLMLPHDDCDHGVRIMRNQQSKSSTRTFERVNKIGLRSPYYEYRDTAMSNLAPFRPEWIKELRVINDNDPKNPDVIYNNGHFMHQITFFIGPVNFYWEINGQKFCQEMNTGDSNYITPFWPHSFASRDSSKEAIIIAVTFGGEVRRSQKELYSLGKRAEKFHFNSRNETQAYATILENLLNNEITSPSILSKKGTKDLNMPVIQVILEGRSIPEAKQLIDLAASFEIDPAEVIIPKYNSDHEVIVKKRDELSAYLFPDKLNPAYKIYPAVRTPKMSGLKGFEIEVLPGQSGSKELVTNMHSYLYNFGENNLFFNWFDGEKKCSSILYPGDSVYLQPFINHNFGIEENSGKLFVVRIPGSVNFSTRKELSSFSDTGRAIKETMCWFD